MGLLLNLIHRSINGLHTMIYIIYIIILRLAALESRRLKSPKLAVWLSELSYPVRHSSIIIYFSSITIYACSSASPHKHDFILSPISILFTLSLIFMSEVYRCRWKSNSNISIKSHRTPLTFYFLPRDSHRFTLTLVMPRRALYKAC